MFNPIKGLYSGEAWCRKHGYQPVKRFCSTAKIDDPDCESCRVDEYCETCYMDFIASYLEPVEKYMPYSVIGDKDSVGRIRNGQTVYYTEYDEHNRQDTPYSALLVHHMTSGQYEKVRVEGESPKPLPLVIAEIRVTKMERFSFLPENLTPEELAKLGHPEFTADEYIAKFSFLIDDNTDVMRHEFEVVFWPPADPRDKTLYVEPK